MTRIILATSLTVVLPMPALAHLGHVGELAGHSHWIGVGAIALAGVIGALAAKGKKGAEPSEPEAEDEPNEEAPA